MGYRVEYVGRREYAVGGTRLLIIAAIEYAYRLRGKVGAWDCRARACTGSEARGSTPQHAKRLGASSIAPASTFATEVPRLRGSASKLTR